MTRFLLLSLLLAAPTWAQSISPLPGWAAEARDDLARLGVRVESDAALAARLDGFAQARTEAERFAQQMVAAEEPSESLPDSSTHPVARPGEPSLRRALTTAWLALPGVVLASDSLRPPPLAAADSVHLAFVRSVVALRQSDPVLRQGDLAVVAANGRAVAFERTLDDERRLVAFNAGDQDAFLELPGENAPQPWTPIFVSRDDTGRIPSLLIYLDDRPSAPGGSRATYGLKIPARTTVVYRPATPADIRPRGLDE